MSQALMVHACNPNYLGGSDCEDHGSKPAQAKLFVRPHINGKKLACGECLSSQLW
jgi:hypothetical protein